MVDVIPASVKDAWDQWNVRGILLFSLSLQAILILIAPFRKATGKSFIIFTVWSGYLLADWAANFAVGLISDSQSDESHPNTPDNTDLLAFWAPFLLLHLGGPDTITALALEDNELWLRHMLGLVSQAVAALYVFSQSLLENRVWLPTVLLFIAGVIKYAERTRALFLASLDRFRDSMLKEPDPGPNYAKLMEEYTTKREAKVPTEIIYIPEPDKETKPPTDILELTDLQVIRKAFKYFNIFKGLVVDLIFSFRERNESRDFFRRLDAEMALRVIEVELNFVYEVMYTKVQVVQSMFGYCFRALAFTAVMSSLGVFYFNVTKSGFNKTDVRITYTLLVGAIILDFIALFMLIFSDWTITKLDVGDDDLEDDNTTGKSVEEIAKEKAAMIELNDTWGKRRKRALASFIGYFLKCKKPYWRTSECLADFDDCDKEGDGNHIHQHWVMSTPILLRRWSGSVAGLDLIRFCLKGGPNRIHEFTGWTRVTIQNITHYTGLQLIYNHGRVEKFIHMIGSSLGATKKGIGKAVEMVTEPVDRFFQSLGIRMRRYMAPRWWMVWLLYLGRAFMWCVRYVLHLPTNLMNLFGLEDFIDSFLYVSIDRLTRELWTYVFHELKVKADYADDPETAKRISSAKGDWVLTDTDTKLPEGFSDEFLQYVNDVKYDESLLLWHIATELCYNYDRPTQEAKEKKKKEMEKEQEKNKSGKRFAWGIPCLGTAVKGTEDEAKKEKKEEGESGKHDAAPNLVPGGVQVDIETTTTDDNEKNSAEGTPSGADGNEENIAKGSTSVDDKIRAKFGKHDYREFSKTMSDYMIYLLVMQPTMMSAVAGIGKIRYRDTCAEAERFFVRRGFKPHEQKRACDQILAVNTDVKPVHVKGDRSKSVLFDACILAKKLNDLDKQNQLDPKKKYMTKWKLLSKIWVELMSYSAAHCRANTHAQQLSKGGELITFVWLLMAHFGLGDQFQINEGHARAKLVVRK